AALAQEGLENQVDEVAHAHIAPEAAQQPKCLQRIVPQLVKEQSTHAGGSLAVDHLAGEAGRIDLRALEILEPVPLVVDQFALQVLLPNGRSAIDAQPVEVEGVER